MRIKINRSIIALLVMLCLTATLDAQEAQYNRNLGLLQGEWVLDIDKSISNLEEASSNYYADLSPEKKQEIRGAFEGKQVIFNSNGEYKIQSYIKFSTEGLLYISKSNKYNLYS